MRALSVRQPYAELILQGVKKEEYRSRATKITGTVYIYASLTADVDNAYDYPIDGLATGMLVGTIDIVGCKKNKHGYAWQLGNPIRLKQNLKPVKKPQPVWFNPF
jgi:hypothetical protein